LGLLEGSPRRSDFAPFSYTSRIQQPGKTQNRKLKSENRSRMVSTILVTVGVSGINQVQNSAMVKFVNLDWFSMRNITSRKGDTVSIDNIVRILLLQ
jgi:hypothetical protein